MRRIMGKLKLTVNETKTRVCRLPEETFDFLGYTFGRCYSPKTGRAYLGTVPSKKRVNRICEAISERDRTRQNPAGSSRRGRQAQPHDDRLGQLLLSGSGQQGLPGSGCTRPQRLRQWLCEKHKVPGTGNARFPDQYLYRELGLQSSGADTRNLPWAKA